MLGHNTTSYKCKQCRQLRPVSDLSHILSHTCAHISAHDKKPYFWFFYAYTQEHPIELGYAKRILTDSVMMSQSIFNSKAH